MEIKTEDYRVWNEGSDVYFDGEIRLANSKEYMPILSFMTNILHSHPASMTVDLRDLEFLNSSGINLLAKFTIDARNHPDVKLVIRGTSEIPWQSKSLPNLKKLHPNLVFLID